MHFNNYIASLPRCVSVLLDQVSNPSLSFNTITLFLRLKRSGSNHHYTEQRMSYITSTRVHSDAFVRHAYFPLILYFNF